jgi:hypothetical protein
MNSSKRIIVCTALAAASAMSLPLAAPAPVQAAPPAACVSSLPLNPAKWQWVLNFDQMSGSSPVACLAAMGADNTVSYSLTRCDVVGPVAIAGGAAVFSGGHVACKFDPPEDGETSYTSFEIYARARSLSDSPFPNGNPIFTHPNVFMYAPTKSSSAGLTSWMQPSFSIVGPVGNVWTPIWARTTGCLGQHRVANRIQSFPAPCNLGFSLNPAEVTIGFNPTTGAKLFGQLTEVTVDPKWGTGD